VFLPLAQENEFFTFSNCIILCFFCLKRIAMGACFSRICRGNRPAPRAAVAPVENKFEAIPDKYTSLKQVTQALREQGLESSNLIVGVDFTKSNLTQGERTFDNLSLHAVRKKATDGSHYVPVVNPYARAIEVVGAALQHFDDDNLIPVFVFGDQESTDKTVRVLTVRGQEAVGNACHGFEQVKEAYQWAASLLSSGTHKNSPVRPCAFWRRCAFWKS